MTGPDHYREAQKLLTIGLTIKNWDAKRVLAEAQVHATLALAAATALGGSRADERHGGSPDGRARVPASKKGTPREQQGSP
jgi:hypothetical protein